MACFGLVADYSSSSDDSVSDSEKVANQEEAKTDVREEKKAEDIPLPSAESLTVGKSIFDNPFARAAEVKQSILEKHVKMTVLNPEVKGPKVTKPKKKVERVKYCRAFLKGNCRYGGKCKFVHQQPSEDVTPTMSAQPSTDQAKTRVIKHTAQVDTSHYADDIVPVEPKPRKRPGLAGGLVPPKRAMSSLSKQRAQERPWTVDS